jgi:hypothetical protein
MAARHRGTPYGRSRVEARERAAAQERDRGSIRELVEFETAAEGSTGEAHRESGTLPGSVGGTTGTAGRSLGVQTPGAVVPAFPGISPERAKQLRRRGEQHPDRGT